MIGTASIEQWERDSQYVIQLRAENAELKQQRDELLGFAKEYVGAWEDGMAGDHYLLSYAKELIASVKGDAA